MTTDSIRLRDEFLNTQVIARNNGKRLGVVREVLVDVDRREVVALGLRDNRFALSGLPRYMYLTSVRQSGDVILVDDEDVLVDVEIELYSQLINSEVITETGEPLGRVRDFQFSLDDGKVSSLILASIGLPQIPEQVLSTYELPIEEIISSGPNRLIVFEGAEERLTQLSVGLLERLGIGRPPWEKEEEEGYYAPTAPPENQLPTGIPVRTPVSQPIQTQATIDNNWSDDDWEDSRNITPPPRRKAQAIPYPEYDEELEESNWSEPPSPRPNIPNPTPNYPSKSPQYEDDSFEENDQPDVWDDDIQPESYPAPRVNIPEKKKVVEYEENDY